jgi:hypothetical protein
MELVMIMVLELKLAASKNVIVKITMFPHRNIHNYTLTSLVGKTHNQIGQVLIDKKGHANILDMQSFRGADCNTDHYLVIANVTQRLSK